MKSKIIFIFICLSFLSVCSARATTYLTDLDYLEAITPGWYLISSNGKYSAQGFIPNQDNLTRVQFYSRYQETAATTSPAIFGICKDDISALTTNLATTNCLTSTTSGELIATTSVIYYKQWTAEFDDPVALEQGEQYYFVWQNNENVYSGIALHYPCGDGCYDPIWNPFISCGEYGCYTNTLFATYYNEDDYLVEFTDDYFDDEPIYKNFDYWNVDYILSESSWGDFSININIYDQNEVLIETQTNVVDPSSTIDTELFENTHEFTNGKYFVSLDLVSNGETVSTEEKKAFFINNETGTDIFPDEELTFFSGYTYDHICDDVATSSGEFWDDFRFGIECGFKKIVYWVIYPSDTSVNNISKGYTKLKKEFPFSAYFGITDTINNAIATTTINNSGTFNIPFISATGSYYMLPVLSSTSMPNLIGDENTELFRNTITWVMWLSMSALIFITIKKI